jgi:uncharacterized protein YwlG (UPF0340 family)
VHADPSTEALFASSFAPASSNFQGKTIGESGTIAQSQILGATDSLQKKRGLTHASQPSELDVNSAFKM